MDELERWLRAAMQAAQQPPSSNLLDGIWRRRRAHLRRTGAWSAAAVVAVAIAVPSLLHATAGRPAQPTRPQASATATPSAAPGSELLKCGYYSDWYISGGQLDARWQSASVHVGPVWFVFARNGGWSSSKRLPHGRLDNVGGPILAVKNGATVEITTPRADWPHFRFLLTRAANSGSYTLTEGVPGLTLVGCPSYRVSPGIPPGDAPGLTLFYLPLGYVTDLHGCLPLRIAEPPSWHVRWTANLSVHGLCK